MKQINLEEILKKELIPIVFADNPEMTFNATKKAMLEFGKQLLELAAKNAKITTYTSRKDNFTKIHYKIDKKAIINTINQVE